MKIILSTRDEPFALTRKTFREFSVNGKTDTLNFHSLSRKAMHCFFSLSQYQRKVGRYFTWTFTDVDRDMSFTQRFFVFVDMNGQLNTGCKCFTANTTNKIRAWALVKRIPRA